MGPDESHVEKLRSKSGLAFAVSSWCFLPCDAVTLKHEVQLVMPETGMSLRLVSSFHDFVTFGHMHWKVTSNFDKVILIMLWRCDAVTLIIVIMTQWRCLDVMVWHLDAVTLRVELCCDGVTLWRSNAVTVWLKWWWESVTLWRCDALTLWACYSSSAIFLSCF